MGDHRFIPKWFAPPIASDSYDLGSWLHDSTFSNDSVFDVDTRSATLVFDLAHFVSPDTGRTVKRLVVRLEKILHFAAFEFVDADPRPKAGQPGSYTSVDWNSLRARLDTDVVDATLVLSERFAGLRIQHHLQGPYAWAETLCAGESTLIEVDGKIVKPEELFRDLIHVPGASDA